MEDHTFRDSGTEGQCEECYGPIEDHPARLHRCNWRGVEEWCGSEGFEVYDYYGIFAGYWCEEHEENAPGQWAYHGPDTEPLDED